MGRGRYSASLPVGCIPRLNEAAGKVQRVVACPEEFPCGKFLSLVVCRQRLEVLDRAGAVVRAARVRLRV